MTVPGENPMALDTWRRQRARFGVDPPVAGVFLLR
jgi:hypothetical protein